jgi:uncharacterized phage protein (TIGR01671 family)
MREILFRAKSVNDYPYPSRWEYGIPFKDSYGSYMMKTSKGLVEVKKETVGEFTGLTDKNGVKIFEGDILESFYKKKRIVSVVKYGAFEPEFFYECAEAQGFFLYGMKLYGLYAYDLAGSEMMLVEDMRQAKIIGNIHDTPEILGGDDHAAD